MEMREDNNGLFVDTNVLVYATVRESPFHAAAFSCIKKSLGEGRSLWISPQVVREYVATLTRPQNFIQPPEHAWVVGAVRKFQRFFKLATDSKEVTAELLNLIEEHEVRGKQVHDANIIATMCCHDIPALVTKNVGDFKRFEHLISIESF